MLKHNLYTVQFAQDGQGRHQDPLLLVPPQVKLYTGICNKFIDIEQDQLV